ncbi:6400_t:CDS:2 [Ambispora leptoticha]|uniref:6400_t:CDS:1 n=1 Tax=Ambispora leptoticha TaxID=144679 RepID=A0A9N9ET88_9GLOM|nr:6400_t:CDS:2 [Ambispora leptoticha]
MPRKRLHTTKACEACRKRKCKCIGKTPCQRCSRLGLECVFVSTLKKRGPQKKIYDTIAYEEDFSVKTNTSLNGTSNVFNSTATINQELSLPSLSQLGLDKFFAPSKDELNRTGNKHYTILSNSSDLKLKIDFKSLKELQEVTCFRLQTLNPANIDPYNFAVESTYKFKLSY